MTKEIIPIERIARAILLLRAEKVMLDSDLAALYGVATGQLDRAIKRNRSRFPSDFMFESTAEEIAAILQAIRQLMAPPEKPRREIGFHVRETALRYRVHKRA